MEYTLGALGKFWSNMGCIIGENYSTTKQLASVTDCWLDVAVIASI